MKRLSLCCAILCCLAAAPFVRAQIPNAGFETWSAGAPTGWITDNSPGVDTVIIQTTDAHSGTYAVRGVTDSLYSVVISPILQLREAWTTRPATFSGYYKFTPVGGDSLIIAAVFAKSGSGVGAATLKTASTVSSYTQFSIPVTYVSANTPDSMAIIVTIFPASGSMAHRGSAFELDDVSLSGTAGVATLSGQTPQTYALLQNYPNPFNPSTTIGYLVPRQSYVSVKVYDILGREVATLVDGIQAAGSHSVHVDGTRLTSGVYFCTMKADGFTQTRRLTLLK